MRHCDDDDDDDNDDDNDDDIKSVGDKCCVIKSIHIVNSCYVWFNYYVLFSFLPLNHKFILYQWSSSYLWRK